ncbi:hypothetical protein [Cohnella sp. GbtcB17]|uniref:hypothetical protein n=1 Tax=Cohnella sp. GbtcB17 TaxID=2824762 RepID=UPI001C2F81F7|nr:hypothetical protein [Cohnella sp. GbtcB17]
MAYATAADYELYGSGLIAPADLDKALERASDQVDTLTYSRITARGFTNLSAFQQLAIKKAVCQQADFVFQYGDYLDMPLSSYSAGSVSVTLNTTQGAGGIKSLPTVSNLLLSTGLTGRGLI